MSQEKYCGKGHNAMITERDKLRMNNSFDRINASTLDPAIKSELKEGIEESLENLNGRNLEDRVLAIAQTQFSQSRFIADLIIQFNEILKLRETPKRTWKDVIAECRWSMVVLGSIIAISAIFSENIVEMVKSIASLIH